MVRIFFTLSIILLLLTAFLPSQMNNELVTEGSLDNLETKEEVLIRLTTSILDKWHYNPQLVNDSFSEKIFDTYLKFIDGSKRFLIKSEVDELNERRLNIDDEIRSGKRDFYLRAQEIISKARSRAKDISEEILAKPLNITDVEFIELKGDKREYLVSETELKDYWRRWLEHEILQRFYTRIRKQEKRQEKETDFIPTSVDSLQIEAQEKVVEVFEKWFKRMEKRDDSDHFSAYLNVLTNIYDPHTNFYKPRDKESFDISMAGKLEGIGARLSTEGKETKVVSIVPGSPSWKQGELEVKDVIIEVGQGDSEVVDLTGMDIDEVVDLIRGKKGTEVRLTVRKVDGAIHIISIIRDVVILEEGFAKSMILEHDDMDFKVGYLKLPKFYADFQDRNGRSSATDVKKELLKLKAEGANTLIFDLRGNSGGSLRDVVEMVGFFVEEGPVVQVKNRNESVELLKDKDRGNVVWDGPVVVMVNKFSASASEIFAAALQDYDRAIIVGSPHTYGKGTVQRFIDLDRTVNGFEEYKPLGSVKYTMQKYYRINGGSTQLKGVISDVILPDSWHFTTIGEKELDYALPWTKIKPADYTQDVYDVSKIRKKLLKRSLVRVKADPEFSQILTDAQRLHDDQEKTRRPLEKDAFFSMKRKDQVHNDAFSDLFKKIDKIKPSNLIADINHIQLDSSRIERNDQWMEALQEDIYVEESIFILKDMEDLH